jgi:TDG/mug DNA glycosylase family protein
VDTLPDLVGPNLLVLFCGINPGLKSAELGQHFARPGNRFWKLLHAGGFTDRVFTPGEQEELPSVGVGITNLVSRPTAAASELRPDEIREGAQLLESKLERLAPRCLAVLGMQAYRTGFSQPKASLGLQSAPLAGAPVWLLPNPSGLQAKYQLAEMTAMYQTLHHFAIDLK